MSKKQSSRSGIKQLFFSIAWISFTSAFILLITAAYSYLNTYQQQDGQLKSPLTSQVLEKQQAAEAAATSSQVVSSIVETDDARSTLIANFLERYHSPIQPYDYYGTKLVEIADRYGLDFRLLPAIAMQESNLCKVTNPNAPHNCLGFGIHSQGTLDFESYEAGFERAGRELRQNYVDQGLDTVALIETKWFLG